MVRTLFDTLDDIRAHGEALEIPQGMLEHGFKSLIIPTDDYVRLMQIYDGVNDETGHQLGMIDLAATRKFPYKNPELRDIPIAFKRRFMHDVTQPDGRTLPLLKPEVKEALRSHANEFLEIMYQNYELSKQLEDPNSFKSEQSKLLQQYNDTLSAHASDCFMDEIASGNLLGDMSRESALSLMSMTIGACMQSFKSYVKQKEGKGIAQTTEGRKKPEASPQYKIYSHFFKTEGQSFTERYAAESRDDLSQMLGR